MSLWEQCKNRLQSELSSQHYVMWIQPLQAVVSDSSIRLLAPNRFVVNWVKDKYLPQINAFLQELAGSTPPQVSLEIGSVPTPVAEEKKQGPAKQQVSPQKKDNSFEPKNTEPQRNNNPVVNPTYTFDNFVEGKSNQLAKAAAMQVAEQCISTYNPLFIYGGVGLGKTHLMHAVGNQILRQSPQAKVIYLHSERFVQHMIRSLQTNSVGKFKNYYRSLDVLLIDDIQFFAGKERSQEEFFHTFNALLEGQRQIIMTSDCYPKEINGLEE